MTFPSKTEMRELSQINYDRICDEARNKQKQEDIERAQAIDSIYNELVITVNAAILAAAQDGKSTVDVLTYTSYDRRNTEARMFAIERVCSELEKAGYVITHTRDESDSLRRLTTELL